MVTKEELLREIAETKTLIERLPDCSQRKQRVSHLKRLYRKLRMVE